jgi:hypothetical protein
MVKRIIVFCQKVDFKILVVFFRGIIFIENPVGTTCLVKMCQTLGRTVQQVE